MNGGTHPRPLSFNHCRPHTFNYTKVLKYVTLTPFRTLGDRAQALQLLSEADRPG